MTSKRVESETVRESVPLRHDEVEIEHRPVTERRDAAGATLGDGEEIRVSLTREEAVVEKRVVPMEEVVVRKHEVVEDHEVETELRRETVEG